MGNQAYDVIPMPAGPATPDTPASEIDKRCTYQCRQCGASAPARISPQQFRPHACRNGRFSSPNAAAAATAAAVHCQHSQLQQQLRNSPIFQQFQQAMQMSQMGNPGGGDSSIVGMIRPQMGGMGMGGMGGMGSMGSGINGMGLMNSCSQTSFGTPMGMGGMSGMGGMGGMGMSASGTDLSNLNMINLQHAAAQNGGGGCLNLSGSGIGLNVMSAGMVRPTCLLQTGGTAAGGVASPVGAGGQMVHPTIMIRPGVGAQATTTRFICPMAAAAAAQQQQQQPMQQRFLTPCKSTGAILDPNSAQACFNCVRSPGMRGPFNM